jgi:hypothetical protein
MDLLNRKTLDASHKALDRLINTTMKASLQACNENDTDTRNKLDMIASHLLAARSVAGTIKTANGIMPLSGGKD